MNQSLETLKYDHEISKDLCKLVKCRMADPEDDASVGDLAYRAFLHAYSKRNPPTIMTEERRIELFDVALRRKKGAVQVIELGSRIVGTYSLSYPFSSGSQAWIYGASHLRCVAIDPEYQGVGFSRLLLESSRALARSWDADAISLHVHRAAGAVSRIYADFGYVRDRAGDTVISGYVLDGYVLKLTSSARSRH